MPQLLDTISKPQNAAAKELAKPVGFLALCIGSEIGLSSFASRTNSSSFSGFVLPVLQFGICGALTWLFSAKLDRDTFPQFGLRTQNKGSFWDGVLAGYVPGIVLAFPLVVFALLNTHGSLVGLGRDLIRIPFQAATVTLVSGGYALNGLRGRIGGRTAVALIASFSALPTLARHPAQWSLAELLSCVLTAMLFSSIVSVAAMRSQGTWFAFGVASGLFIAPGRLLPLWWNTGIESLVGSYWLLSFGIGVPGILLLVCSGLIVLRTRFTDRRLSLSSAYMALWTAFLGTGSLIFVEFVRNLFTSRLQSGFELGWDASIFFFGAFLVLLILLYRGWAAIQDGKTRYSPSKAIGLLFVPFFNVYWLFRAVSAFPTEYNRYVQRHAIRANPLSQGIYLTFCILFVASCVPVLGVFPWLIAIALTFPLISKTRAAINELGMITGSSSAEEVVSRVNPPADLMEGHKINSPPSIPPMNEDQALAILGLSAAADRNLVQSRYAERYTELTSRLKNAPTPELKAKFNDELTSLVAATECLAPGSTRDPDVDLPSPTRTDAQFTVIGIQPQLQEKSKGRRSRVVAASLIGLTITVATGLAVFTFKLIENPRIVTLQPSGPIVKVPEAILFEGGATFGNGGVRELPVDLLVKIEHARLLHPKDPRTLNDLGVAYGSIGQLSAGNELLKQALNYAPNDPTISYNLARGLLQQGKIADSIRYADNAINLKPDLDAARLLRAAAAVRQGDYETAEQQLQKLINEGVEIALVISGVVELAKGKTQEALASFQAALKLAPKDATALYNTGVISQRQNNLSDATNLYKQAIANDPGLAEAHNNLGTILARNNQGQAALEEFKQASNLSPEDTVFRDHVAKMSSRLSPIWPPEFLRQASTAIDDAARHPGNASSQNTPTGYSALPEAERKNVGLGGQGAGTITVTNQAGQLLEIEFTGPTNSSALIPAGLSKSISLAEGAYRIVGRTPGNPQIRPFYGTDFYKRTERYSLTLVIEHTPSGRN